MRQSGRLTNNPDVQDLFLDDEIISLHKTKRGAFKAMVKYINAEWHKERAFIVMREYHYPLQYSRWRIRELVVLDDETQIENK